MKNLVKREKIGKKMAEIVLTPFSWLAGIFVCKTFVDPFINGMNGMPYEDHEARAEEVRRERGLLK